VPECERESIHGLPSAFGTERDMTETDACVDGISYALARDEEGSPGLLYLSGPQGARAEANPLVVGHQLFLDQQPRGMPGT